MADKFSRLGRLLMPGESSKGFVVVKRGMLPTLRVKDGLAAWFRFGKGITHSSNAVSQWNDQSGNGRHLKQATGANQPTLQSDGSILFDGTAHFMKCDAFTLNQPCTHYFLGRQVTYTNGDSIFDGNAVNQGRLRQQATSPTIQVFASATPALANSEFTVNTYGAVVLVLNGASSSLQVNNGSVSTGDPGASNPGGFTLGADGGSGGFSNIQVKEVLIYSAAHDSATRALVIKYLAQVGKLTL